MTEPIEVSTAPPEFAPESFAAIVFRRTRYVIAILAAAFLFHSLGWLIAAPPPGMEGVSLLGWSGEIWHALVVAAELAGVLIVASTLCTLIVHPDSPHTGFFCALVGMFALAIRGGNIFMLLQDHMGLQELADGSKTIQYVYPHIARVLAAECLLWAVIILVAEEFTRVLHERFFANTRWITRSGPDLSMQVVARLRPTSAAMGISLVVSKALRTEKMRRRFATPLAIVYSAVVGVIVLFLLMHSILKGQVLFACFAAFFLATLAAYLAFPRVPFVALILAVPLTAAGGYLYGMNMPSFYPGYPAFFMMRALPIDYMAAGVPGAIAGYYAAFRWSLHSPPESDS